jgi:hypothetical protein
MIHHNQTNELTTWSGGAVRGLHLARVSWLSLKTKVGGL